MRRVGAFLIAGGCVGALAAGPASAELTRAALAQVGVHAPAGAREPLDLAFQDSSGARVTLGQAMGGEPALLVFEDYRCKTLCGPALSIAAAGIQASGLEPGRDMRLIAIGLNPHETPADASALRTARLASDPRLMQGSSFLTGAPGAIARAAGAVGYGYAYDAESGQFTHPVTAFALSPDGRVSEVLAETALTGPALRAAVLGARRGEVGDLVDRLAVFCHDLLPLAGRYDAIIQGGLRLAGVATLAVMAAGLALLVRRRRLA